MSNPVIKAESLNKRYFVGHQNQERYIALRDVIANEFTFSGSKNNTTIEFLTVLTSFKQNAIKRI